MIELQEGRITVTLTVAGEEKVFVFIPQGKSIYIITPRPADIQFAGGANGIMVLSLESNQTKVIEELTVFEVAFLEELERLKEEEKEQDDDLGDMLKDVDV